MRRSHADRPGPGRPARRAARLLRLPVGRPPGRRALRRRAYLPRPRSPRQDGGPAGRVGDRLRRAAFRPFAGRQGPAVPRAGDRRVFRRPGRVPAGRAGRRPGVQDPQRRQLRLRREEVAEHAEADEAAVRPAERRPVPGRAGRPKFPVPGPPEVARNTAAGGVEMPEWCDNLLTVEGPEAEVDRFARRARGRPPRYRDATAGPDADGEGSSPAADVPEKVFCFHALYPVPEEVLAAGQAAAGHEWEGEHWGCKWGACDQEVAERSPGRIAYRFDNPWDPALPFLDRVAADWPGLSFTLRYHTDWSGYRGVARWAGGRELSHFRERAGQDVPSGPEEGASEAAAYEAMARRYREAALSLPGGPAGEVVPVFLLLQSAELLLRWRLAEVNGGPLPEEHRKGHRVGELIAALAAVPRWAAPAAGLPESSRAWWEKVAAADDHLAAFRFPRPAYDDGDRPACTGTSPAYPPAATGRRFWRESSSLWDTFGESGVVASCGTM